MNRSHMIYAMLVVAAGIVMIILYRQYPSADASLIIEKPPKTGAAMKQPMIRFTRISPVLAVKDVPSAIAFYRDRLGFKTTLTADDPPVYAIMQRDGIAIHLAGDSAAAGGKGGFYLEVGGADGLFQSLKAANVTIQRPIEDSPYGLRDFVIRDPDGNTIGIGEPIRQSQKQERRSP